MGTKHWIVQVHSVPSQARCRVSTSRDVHLAQDDCGGDATTPQFLQRDPTSSGASTVPTTRPSCRLMDSVCCGIDTVRGLEADGGRARDHVLALPAVAVELGDGQERPDPLAAVAARLAERELDATPAVPAPAVSPPAARAAGVDEAPQLLARADELAALRVRAVGPLDREADRIGDQLQRGVR